MHVRTRTHAHTHARARAHTRTHTHPHTHTHTHTHTQSIHKRMVQFQKLMKNTFLILHGHNIHCQQQIMSTFVMRYQQFACHAYCGAAVPVSKMASQQQKAFCVLRFEVSRSVMTVQPEFRAWFKKDAPYNNNVTRWYRQFVETGCLCNAGVLVMCLMTILKEFFH
jgi:hypothetical protein